MSLSWNVFDSESAVAFALAILHCVFVFLFFVFCFNCMQTTHITMYKLGNIKTNKHIKYFDNGKDCRVPGMLYLQYEESTMPFLGPTWIQYTEYATVLLKQGFSSLRADEDMMLLLDTFFIALMESKISLLLFSTCNKEQMENTQCINHQLWILSDGKIQCALKLSFVFSLTSTYAYANFSLQ